MKLYREIRMFGDWIREVRRNRSLPRKSVADKAGITVSTLSQIERGSIRRPPEHRLRGIADALRIPYRHLKNRLDASIRASASGASKIVASSCLAYNAMLGGISGGLPAEKMVQPVFSFVEEIEKPRIDLHSYDHFIVAFSGGKDSVACVLLLLEQGIPKEKVELWHHAIDGREGSDLMDWPCTPAYCDKFAEAFGLKIRHSWKVGGFEGELLRFEQATAPTRFEDIDGNVVECGGFGPKNTRRKFPQKSADLSTRWCSAYLKIGVCGMAIRNQDRFLGMRTLVITGERGEESSSRAKYAEFEPDGTDNRNGRNVKRHVDHWRPVHSWSESDVWAIIEKHHVLMHPAYRLGWNRLSCISCVFGSRNQWSSVRAIDPERFSRIAKYEEEFGVTIDRKKSVVEMADSGCPYPDMDPELVRKALSRTYDEPIIVENWTLPAGTYGENAGPT
jgi:3'-phosphoadenosine 5'-phosphosulfate sulfotransferase (PAPS reductase)/FAD synthetase/DNA-binding XRE family transcriptional regulator